MTTGQDQIGPVPGMEHLDIVRYVITPVMFRADDPGADDDSLGMMDVRFSPFNSWYRIDSWWEGSFMERTVPGAFKRTIAQHNDPKQPHDMKTLFNHGMDMHIGDKLLGDIVNSREEKDSPVNTVRLWDTSYNRDLLPGLKRGAYGSSFIFRVTKEEWNNEPEPSAHNPDGLPERTIKETHTLEAGPVTWPASPTASASMNSARQRCASGTDAFYEMLARRNPAHVERMRSQLIALRGSHLPRSEDPTDPARKTRDTARPNDSGTVAEGLASSTRAARLRAMRLDAMRLGARSDTNH